MRVGNPARREFNLGTDAMKEADVTRQVKVYLERLRAAGEPCWWLKVAGGPYQQSGVPDLLLCCWGQWMALELKRPGGRTRKKQEWTIGCIEKAGGRACVASSPEEAIELIEALRCEKYRSGSGDT